MQRRLAKAGGRLIQHARLLVLAEGHLTGGVCEHAAEDGAALRSPTE